MQGVPEQFTDERDSARFRHLAQLPGLELYHAHISDYAFEPHTHEAFGIGTIETGAERFRYRGTQHLAAEKSVVTMNPDEIHTGESATEGGWRYRMVYIEPDLLEEVTGLRHWWFNDVTRHDPLRSQQIGRLIYGLWHQRSAGAEGAATGFDSDFSATGPSCAGGAGGRAPLRTRSRLSARQLYALADPGRAG